MLMIPHIEVPSIITLAMVKFILDIASSNVEKYRITKRSSQQTAADPTVTSDRRSDMMGSPPRFVQHLMTIQYGR